MNRFRLCFLILGVLLFSATAFGQSETETTACINGGSPSQGATSVAYVSDGGPCIYNIYSDGTLVPVYDGTLGPYYGSDSGLSNANFTSLAIGPDDVDEASTGDAQYPFLIYACDTANQYIIRFSPNGNVYNNIAGAVGGQNPSPSDEVYTNSLQGALYPVCGRSTSTGDFYVTNYIAGEPPIDPVDVYEFAGVANQKLGSLSVSLTPIALSGSGLPGTAAANAGITQKNVGDLLLVDYYNNAVYRAPYGYPFSTVTSYISSTTVPKLPLSGPTGIARISTGDIFVANSSNSTISHFNSSPAPSSNCSTLTIADGSTISYLAASETDIIYAVTTAYSEDSSNKGELWYWSPAQPNQCSLTPFSLTSSPNELSGIAIAPIPTNTIQPPLNTPNPTTYSFNSNELQIDTESCSTNPQVTAYPLSLVNIQTMLGLLPAGTFPYGARPGLNLGEQGYEIAYKVDWSNCSPPSGSKTIPLAIFGLYDTIANNPDTVTNPQIVRCDSTPGDSPEEPYDPLGLGYVCSALTPIASFPTGGPIPSDNGIYGGTPTNSVFFLVNEKPTTVTADLGKFCNLIPPNGLDFPTNGLIPVAFQLAQTTGNCLTGPFISNADVLLSAVQTTNGAFVPVLELKTLLNQGTTFPEPILCKYAPYSLLACTYLLTIEVQPSGMSAGTYDLSVVPLTGNASPQEISLTVVSIK